MKTLLLVIMTVSLSHEKTMPEGDYQTKSGHVSFFAEAPVANVDATNDKAEIELKGSSHELTIKLNMRDFDFKNQKMGRDAERKYLETEKYPEASFVGTIKGSVDFSRPGSYPVVASGKLKIHGVEKQVSEKGTITVSKSSVTVASEFNVLLKDYNIDTPSILGKDMTADHVTVKVHATLVGQSSNAFKK